MHRNAAKHDGGHPLQEQDNCGPSTLWNVTKRSEALTQATTRMNLGAEGKEPDTKGYALYDSIYIKSPE